MKLGTRMSLFVRYNFPGTILGGPAGSAVSHEEIVRRNDAIAGNLRLLIKLVNVDDGGFDQNSGPVERTKADCQYTPIG